MKRGLITESHVVIYCDTCGDVLTDADGESICFDSTHQAVGFLNVKVSGWSYDGDRVTCDVCSGAVECLTNGHRWAPGWQQEIWPVTGDITACSTCGLIKSELEQEN
ncbi:hypothetical protein [Nocardia ignorata]|uniref:Uncharacterized protein n=1 Tax=Nocardia ignorata TaxID=145285 RepID=A0A4R6P4N6_NOCIG|nr:hypothetical protein [Nocardia ignorata]TDP32335.1 hypothetical protein DFR75_106125 [Nocardia ignorata]